MSFALPQYLLVEPKTQLMERVRTSISDLEFAGVLLDRVAICKTFVAGGGGEDANIAEVKIAYLSRLLVDTLWDSPGQFEQLFGSSQLNVELFDRWWVLTELDVDLFEDLEKSVDQAAPFISPQQDRRVDAWLRKHGWPGSATA